MGVINKLIHYKNLLSFNSPVGQMSQWQLTEREYLHLPYVQGKGEEQDRKIRRECCELIYTVGASIGL